MQFGEIAIVHEHLREQGEPSGVSRRVLSAYTQGKGLRNGKSRSFSREPQASAPSAKKAAGSTDPAARGFSGRFL
jgi:hypothetical protein